MSGILRLLAFGVGALGWAAAPLAACGRAPQPGHVRADALADHGEARSDRHHRPEGVAGWLGVVLPRQSVDVAPEIPGTVERVQVREGDPVHRGQTIAVLDGWGDREELAMAEAEQRAAEAEVRRSRLALADARDRLSRRLAAPELFPEEEIRRAENAKQIAETDLESAEAGTAEQRARVALARERLAKAVLRAPLDGTVARRYLEPGAFVGPGQPVVRLIGGASRIVRFAAPPEEARSLGAGTPVNVEVGGAEVPAILESVSPEVDPPSGMVILVAVLDPRAAIEPGSVARVYSVSATATAGGR